MPASKLVPIIPAKMASFLTSANTFAVRSISAPIIPTKSAPLDPSSTCAMFQGSFDSGPGNRNGSGVRDCHDVPGFARQ